ncbi:MerR family transcriptional regulator [Pontibacillus marinus]|uniref:Uncharacterized protein n=1 Tax=Pontibacillus marinus BH030004 = DSM 16465 TaxID=1385511 RepID=A0A0A5G9K6_9BACI|nr:DNA-binding protein [Pontibacillus marinus]KGX88729.1 hypothetical protein N783_07420 [Pontibacillus marinus BH030004 = DSM 16465]
MAKHFISGTILLLCISIFYLGFQLHGVAKVDNKAEAVEHEEDPSKPSILNMEKGLWTLEEAAAYLSLTSKELDKIIVSQRLIRMKRSSYPTYDYIPYVQINGKFYFSKTKLDKWIKQSTYEEIGG